jgi:hypothetical protein
MRSKTARRNGGARKCARVIGEVLVMRNWEVRINKSQCPVTAFQGWAKQDTENLSQGGGARGLQLKLFIQTNGFASL